MAITVQQGRMVEKYLHLSFFPSNPKISLRFVSSRLTFTIFLSKASSRNFHGSTKPGGKSKKVVALLNLVLEGWRAIPKSDKLNSKTRKRRLVGAALGAKGVKR